jgi:ATP-binding cassette subfamily F protein 3
LIGDETVLEIATGQAGILEEIEKELQELESIGQIECAEYYQAQAKFDALSDPGLEAKSKKMLRGLGYKESDFDRAAKEMSGGWVMRAHLARILAMEPDLIMLDEPTNHLDLEALLWFQQYLSNFPGAVLLISHDRAFMDDLVKIVYDIEDKKLVSYKGSYSEFEEEKEKRFDQRLQAWKNQQKEIERNQEFIDRFRSVASKAAQAQSRQRQLDKMERLEKPKPIRKLFKIQFPQPTRSGQRVVSLKGVNMAYGENVIYENLNVDIERGDRIALVGPNGSGKSTLIKIMAGELEFQSGERDLGHNCRIETPTHRP